MADQKRRSIVCARNRTVEDFLNIDISLLPFSTSEIRAITRLRDLSLILIAKRAPQFLPAQNSIEWRASVLPKRQALVFPASQPRWRPTLTKSRSLTSRGG